MNYQEIPNFLNWNPRNLGVFQKCNWNWNWSMGKVLYVLGSVKNSKSTTILNLIYHKWSPNAWTEPRGSRERKYKNDLKLEERGDEIPWVMIQNRQRSVSRGFGEFERVWRDLDAKWRRKGSQWVLNYSDRYAGLKWPVCRSRGR